jgi:hypothetical protein
MPLARTPDHAPPKAAQITSTVARPHAGGLVLQGGQLHKSRKREVTGVPCGEVRGARCETSVAVAALVAGRACD